MMPRKNINRIKKYTQNERQQFHFLKGYKMCYFEVRQPHPLDVAVAVDAVVVVGGSETVAASEEDCVLL